MTPDAETLIAACATPYPGAGTLRLHPQPELLARADPTLPGRNRFDDPAGHIAVRYSATRLSGCLRETLARFRPSHSAEALLQAVDGINEDDLDPQADDPAAIADWLAVQRIGTIRLVQTGEFVDVERDAALIALDKHPDVRAAVDGLDPGARLDVAYLRLGGRIGRPVSQAVGTAVREWMPDALGIGYRSRLATDEPCWATWDSVDVAITSEPLDPSNPRHREAVRSTAAAYEIMLPPDWAD